MSRFEGGYSEWNGGYYSAEPSYGRRRTNRVIPHDDVTPDYDHVFEMNTTNPRYPRQSRYDLEPDYSRESPKQTARGRREWAKQHHRGYDPHRSDDLAPDYDEPEPDFSEPEPDFDEPEPDFNQSEPDFDNLQPDYDDEDGASERGSGLPGAHEDLAVSSTESFLEKSTQSSRLQPDVGEHAVDDDATSVDTRLTIDPENVSVSSFDRVRTFARMRPDPRKRKPELKVEQVRRRPKNVSVKHLQALFSKMYRCGQQPGTLFHQNSNSELSYSS